MRIQRFREFMREAGVEEVVEVTLNVYLDESPGRVDRLLEAMGRADARSIEIEAHALKSACLNIWAVALAEYLEQAENAAVVGDISRAQSLMEPIRVEFGLVVEYLDRVLSGAS